MHEEHMQVGQRIHQCNQPSHQLIKRILAS